MTRMSESELREYRRRHPHLFPEPPAPAPAPAPAAGLPASATNGYASEADFQDAVVRALVERGWTVWQMYRGSQRGGSVWATKGIPDLFAFRAPGLLLWLELKQPGNKPSPAQLERHEELRRAGLPITVAWTLEQVLLAARALSLLIPSEVTP